VGALPSWRCRIGGGHVNDAPGIKRPPNGGGGTPPESLSDQKARMQEDAMMDLRRRQAQKEEARKDRKTAKKAAALRTSAAAKAARAATRKDGNGVNPTSGVAGGSIAPSNARARSASRGRAMTGGGDPVDGAAGGMPLKVRPSSARRTRRTSAEGEDETPSRARQMLETPLVAVKDIETPSHAHRHGAETSRRTSCPLKPEARVLQYNRKARFT